MRAIKTIRLKDYDYSSDGYYFVTVCTNYKKPCLVGDIKILVNHAIEDLPRKIGGLEVDYHKTMPTHVHLILVLQSCEIPLSEAIRRFKATTTQTAGFRLWQPNYYEHVIRDENALGKVREYIQNNPMAEKL